MSDDPFKKKARQDYIDAVQFPETVTLTPIGVVRSPYRERHGTPRQAVVSRGALGGKPQDATIELFSEVVPPEAFTGLEGFSHIWVVTWLHLNRHWNPMVVPPRGPKKKQGVLATRAPHRPNQIGLSALRLVGVDGGTLHVRGIDLLDQTPVLDVKPYVPYADAFPDARAGWLDELDEAPDGPDRPS